METQMEQLVQRLEKAVAKLEKKAGITTDSEQDNQLPDYSTMIDIINKMEQSAKTVQITNEDLKKILDNEILVKLSLQIRKAFTQMMMTLHCSLLVAKPDQKEIQNLYALVDKMGLDELFKTDKKFTNTQLFKTMKEGLKYFRWQYSNDIFSFLKAQHESTDFYFVKVKMMKDKEVNSWYSHIIDLFKEIKVYVNEHFSSGLLWQKQPKGNYSIEQLIKDIKEGKETISLVGATVQKQPVQQNAQQTINPDKHQEQHKQDTDQKQKQDTNQKQKQDTDQKQKQEQCQNKAVKQASPSKQFRMGKWFIENFKSESIEFKDGELKMNHTLYIYNCEDIQIVINEKVNQITLEKCKSVKLQTEKIISMIELINCDKFKIQSNNTVPLINIDKSSNVSLYLIEEAETEVITSLSSTIDVSLKEGDGYCKAHPITTQLMTKWERETKKFKTIQYDRFN